MTYLCLNGSYAEILDKVMKSKSFEILPTKKIRGWHVTYNLFI